MRVTVTVEERWGQGGTWAVPLIEEVVVERDMVVGLRPPEREGKFGLTLPSRLTPIV